ncbi:hypothetical protein HMPREF0972_01899 [Actinomyces sp. oral taxon 848 str. F0332]|nr:hypothetical protein HMPREF0972_01899 [Actinomyces sp. oral taxon 848 str. F0332]
MTRASHSPSSVEVDLATNLPCKEGAHRTDRKEKKTYKIRCDSFRAFAPHASRCHTGRNEDDTQLAETRRTTFGPSLRTIARHPPKIHLTWRINITFMPLLYARIV